MSKAHFARSSLPCEVVASDTHNALSNHIFPPFYPRPAYIKLPAPPKPPTPARQSPRSHTPVPAAPRSLPKSSSREPTVSIRKLFEIYPSFRFHFDTQPPGTIVDLKLRPAQKPASKDVTFVQGWNSTLRQTENAMWFRERSHLPMVPTYAQRSRGQLQGGGDIGPVILRYRPGQETAATGRFLSFIQPLLTEAFEMGGPVLRDEITSNLVSRLWLGRSDTGDIVLAQPAAMSRREWEGVANFIVKMKYVSHEDLLALVQASKRGMRSCSSSSAQSSADTGFTLSMTNKKFSTDADQLPDVFENVLAQLVEEFSTHHADLILLGNYDEFVLISLIAADTASVSDLIYRDPNLHPQVATYPPGHAMNPALLEVIIAGIIGVGRAADKGLWRDMVAINNLVREEAAKTHGVSKGDHSKGSLSTTSGTEADAATSMFTVRPSPDWMLGYGPAQHNSLMEDGDEVFWSLQSPGNLESLFHRLHSMCCDYPPGTALASPSPPKWPSSSSPPSPPPPTSLAVTPKGLHLFPAVITMNKYLSSGRLFDVYSGTLSVGGGVFQAALKFVDFETFRTQEDRGSEQFTAMFNEIILLKHADAFVPGIAPRFVGLWCGPRKEKYMVAVEDVGHKADLTNPATADAVRDAYAAVHDAGMIHGDVEARHIFQDKAGRVRIIDWDAGGLGSRTECQAEMRAVEHMLERAARRAARS